ncbi:MAG: hypothetical protein ACE5E8_08045 [Acidimicrobiia bacterium]
MLPIGPKSLFVDGPGFGPAPVQAALGMRRRFGGIKTMPRGWSLLLRARSVHGFGLRLPVNVARLDETGLVLEVRLLQRRRMLWWRRPQLLLEVAPGLSPPAQGARLIVRRKVT